MVVLGIDTAICPGSSLTITPSFSNVDVWAWQDGSTNPFFQANTAGQINVQVSNGCSTAYDTMVIGLLPDIPLLSLGPDTAICPGSSITLSITIPDVDILWSDGSFNPDLTISDSMIVMATISNTCGMAVDAIQIDLLPDAPVLQLGPDQTICPGEVIVLDPDIVGVNYLWQDGSTGPQLNITQQGLVILTVFNECGSDTDSLVITESTNGPQLDLGPDLVACEGATISIPANIGGVNYLWQDGSTDDIYIATASGTYILEVSNLCGADRDTIVVDISGRSPLPPVSYTHLDVYKRQILILPVVDTRFEKLVDDIPFTRSDFKAICSSLLHSSGRFGKFTYGDVNLLAAHSFMAIVISIKQIK